jgi:hypothetical protein
VKYSTLAILPFAVAATFLGVCLAIGDTPSRSVFLRVEIESVKALAFVGCAAAALAFERGDYLRRAWFFSAADIFLLLVRDLTLAFDVPRAVVVRGILVSIANVFGVVSTFMLARAWSISGLDDDATRKRRRWMFALGCALSIALTGGPLVLHVRALAHGQWETIAPVASDLGDTISVALLAPVLQTALAMGSGSLRWPWSLLASSGVSWLLYDATVYGSHATLVSETFRSLACMFLFSAGLAQRKAIA